MKRLKMQNGDVVDDQGYECDEDGCTTAVLVPGEKCGDHADVEEKN